MMAKKIGILAFSSCTNYGGMLQVYAMQEALAMMGHLPVVLNLWVIPNNKYLYGSAFNPYAGIGTRIKGLKNWIFSKTYRLFEHRYKAFQKWQSVNLHMSKDVWRTAEEFSLHPPSNVDLIEIGSDQVFNNDVSRIFLCNNVPLSLPRISYGGSFGGFDKDEAECIRLVDGLSKFSGISVREKTAQEFVYKLLGYQVPWVVDPVLLLDRTFWYTVSESFHSKKEEPYIFIYWLGETSLLKERLSVLRRTVGDLPIRLIIGAYDAKIMCDIGNVQILWNADPFDFLRELSNAAYVLSNSFHAMMFSIIYGKKAFFVIGENGRKSSSSRFTDIATVLHCEKALHVSLPADRFDFYDMSKAYHNGQEMIDFSKTVLMKLCCVESGRA